MKYATGGAVVMKPGPNNTSGIVWAISEFFFFFSSFFLKPANVYVYSVYMIVVYDRRQK